MTWQADALEEYGSARKIGEALHGRLPPTLKARWKTNLGNKVSELLNGDTGWWRRTGARALDELAEILGVPVAELLGVGATAVDALDFPEFPALPPLRPDETPFMATVETSLVALAVDYKWNEVAASFRRWIVAPPGSGKSLVVRYLAASAPTRYRAASVETLEAALAFVADRSTSLVVEVERSAPTDPDALDALVQSTHACAILAPFQCPGRAWRAGGSRSSRTETGWEIIEPPAFSTWRGDLARWIAQRIKSVKGRKTHLNADGVCAWLDRYDPACVIVATPGDLVALCADLDLHREELPLGDRAERWLRDVGTARIGEAAPKAWRDRFASRTYCSLLDARVRRLEVDVAAIALPDWEGLVPRETGARRANGELDAPLVVGAFVHAGLLRSGDRGVVPYPRWVAQGAVEAKLAAEFDTRDPSAWGILAADESRKALVDGALDRLAPGPFRKIVKTVVAAFDRDSLGKRAALETVFASAARRLHLGEAVPEADHAVWQKLVCTQLDNLEGSGAPGDRPTPYTRRDPEELVVNAWTLSLHVTAPTLNTDHGWLVPGWRSAALRFADLPAGLSPCVHDGTEPSPHDASRRTCEIAPVVIALVEVQELEDSIPRVLLPALLLDTARDWPLRPGHLTNVGRGSWEEAELLRLAGDLEPEARAAAASRIWRLLPTMRDGACVVERIEILGATHPQLSEFVLDNLAADTVVATVAAEGLHVRRVSGNSHVEKDPQLLKRLPRSVRTRALRAWHERPAVLQSKWTEAHALLTILEHDDLALAIQLARNGDRETAAQFATFVWGTDPEAAGAEAEAALLSDANAASPWFWAAPRAALAHLTEILRQGRVPAWARSWAYRRALESGRAAAALYALSREASGADGFVRTP
jgi:hypothetical protein